MMQPLLRLTISRATPWPHKNIDFRLMRITRSKSSSQTSRKSAAWVTPALLTRMSIWPKRARVSFSIALTSAQKKCACGPSAAAACAPSSLMSTSITCAPSAIKRLAHARPMPCVAPVTMAVLPCNFMLFPLLVVAPRWPDGHPARQKQILIPARRLQKDGFVRQLITARAGGGEMTLQQGIELLQRLQGAVVEVAAGKTRGHGAAHGLPFFRADTAPHIAVGHDIDLARGEVDVDQHATIVFRIPHAILGEQFARPLTVADARIRHAGCQGCFDDQPDFCVMDFFAIGDGRFDGFQGGFGKRLARCRRRAAQVFQGASATLPER